MGFNHFDGDGNAIMVDVGEKAATRREAVATGRIRMNKACFAAVQSGSAKKGDVLGVARVAGIMASKNTAALIPLCHGLNLTHSSLAFELHEESCEVSAVCTVRCEGKTGVEMEALTGVGVALLTIYDMCKAMDKSMEINGVRLQKKTGGKNGLFQHD